MRDYKTKPGDSSETHTKKCQKSLDQIIAWYQRLQEKYNKPLKYELLDELDGGLRKEEDDLSKQYEPDFSLTLEDYENHFNSKVPVFVMADFLCKHILSTYSYGPKYSEYREMFQTLNDDLSWLNYKADGYLLLELVQDTLARNQTGEEINLSVLLEDRKVRNNLVHNAQVSPCMSAIRCYNIIREMLLFLKPEAQPQLPSFDYPEETPFDMQRFMAHTENINFDQQYMILFVGNIRDIKKKDQKLLANLPWDFVFDFDPYTAQGGLKSCRENDCPFQRLNQANAHQITKDGVLKGQTRWFTFGEFLSLSIAEGSKPRQILQSKEPFYSYGSTGRSGYTKELKDCITPIFDAVKNQDTPVQIFYLYHDNLIANAVLQMAKNTFGESYAFSGIYYWTQDEATKLKERAYADEIACEEDFEDNFAFFCAPPALFLEKLEAYKNDLPIEMETHSLHELPHRNKGFVEIGINDVDNLEQCFEVLYRNIGDENGETFDRLMEGFYTGSRPVPWCAFRHGGGCIVDLLSKDDLKKHLQAIRTSLGTVRAEKIFHIDHAPGIGGSTILRQIGWELHEEHPVLLLKKYDKTKIEALLRHLYDDILNQSFVLMVDEGCVALHDLEEFIMRFDRPCVLVASVRDGTKSSSYKSIDLVKIEDRCEKDLRNLYRDHSPLSKEQLEEKDEDYETVIGSRGADMRCPFMIGLYYFDEHFQGIENYTRQIVEDIQKGENSERRIKAVAFMALCDVYGNTPLPRNFIDDLWRLRKENITKNMRSTQRAFYMTSQSDTAVYKAKHPLISKRLLDLCCRALGFCDTNDQDIHRECLARLAKEFINALFSYLEGKKSFPAVYGDKLKTVFIIERGDFEETGDAKDFSKIIDKMRTHQEKCQTMELLAKSTEALADVCKAEEWDAIYKNAAHFYGHLGRLYSRIHHDADYGKAMEWGKRSVTCIENCESISPDPLIYHMYAEAIRYYVEAQITTKAGIKCKDIDAEEIADMESKIDEAIGNYEKADQFGKQIGATLQKMKMLIKYLRFQYEIHDVSDRNNLGILSEKQQGYHQMILDCIESMDELDMGEKDEAEFQSRISDYNARVRLTDHGKAIEYHENRLTEFNKNGAAPEAIINERNRLIQARLEKYRDIETSVGGTIQWHKMEKRDAERIFSLLNEALEDNINKRSYRERQRRKKHYAHWMQLAKLMDCPISDAKAIAERWAELDKESPQHLPWPYYYCYVIEYLNRLDGNPGIGEDGLRKFQNESIRLAGNKGFVRDRIKDYFIKGKGMGQLLSASGMTIKALLENLDERKKLREISGSFDSVESKVGQVTVRSPGAWLGQKACFRTGEGNSLSDLQTTHTVKFYGGFSFEKITAIDSKVADENAGETLSFDSPNPLNARKENNTSIARPAEQRHIHSSASSSPSAFAQLLDQTYPKGNGIIQRPPNRGKLTKNQIYEGTITNTRFQERNRVLVAVGDYSEVSVDYSQITGFHLNEVDVRKLEGKTVPVKIIEHKKGFYIGKIKEALDRLGQ